MSIHKVNTDAITAAAARIRESDTVISDAFGRTVEKGRAMDCSWNSRAGSAAQKLLNSLIQGNEARSAVLLSHAATLDQVVAPGYVEAERVNSKLSDLFD